MTATYPKHSDKSAIRDAATVIVLRDRMTQPRVLMGQRGAKAVFMPNKFVFPGGAVDAGDAAIPLARPMPDGCAARVRLALPVLSIRARRLRRSRKARLACIQNSRPTALPSSSDQ